MNYNLRLVSWSLFRSDYRSIWYLWNSDHLILLDKLFNFWMIYLEVIFEILSPKYWLTIRYWALKTARSWFISVQILLIRSLPLRRWRSIGQNQSKKHEIWIGLNKISHCEWLEIAPGCAICAPELFTWESHWSPGKSRVRTRDLASATRALTFIWRMVSRSPQNIGCAYVSAYVDRGDACQACIPSRHTCRRRHSSLHCRRTVASYQSSCFAYFCYSLSFVAGLAVNVTLIVSSHCSLVAGVVVACLDFPIVDCSIAGSSDEVVASQVIAVAKASAHPDARWMRVA